MRLTFIVASLALLLTAPGLEYPSWAGTDAAASPLRFRKARRHRKSCEQWAAGQMCLMLYAPAECTAVTVGGAPLRNPVTSEGSNSCFATVSLKRALCERGIRPEEVQPEDITCVVEYPVICAIPDCAAPPEGCRYEGPPPQDDQGCPMGCGTLLCSAQPPNPAP